MPPRRIRRPSLIAILAAGALGAAACESPGARATAPRGAEAFARFRVIGAGAAAGDQSGGLVAAGQAVAWPALLAGAADAAFAQATVRTPGCPAPLVAPLVLGRRLSSTSVTAADSSCAGLSVAFTPPGHNLAIDGATAWDALRATPKSVAAAPGARPAVMRARYPQVLASTQSQVTATLVAAPTLVAVELGLGEVIRAATSGRVVAAGAYEDPAPWTLVGPALFTAEMDAIADSLAKSGARVVLLSVPPVTKLPAFRSAADVWNARAVLATFGVGVNADCAASANVLHVGALLPVLAARAAAAGAAQALSCADAPGTADGVLTPADVAAIDQTVAAFNAYLSSLATTRRWALADVSAAYGAMIADAGAYSARNQLTCVAPYGRFLSLDGVRPAAAGQQRIADAVAAALNGRYGFALPIVGESLALSAPACP